MTLKQEFVCTANNNTYYVIILRSPNGNGFLKDVYHNSDFCYDKAINVVDRLSHDDREMILDLAAVEWDNYWSVDNIKCAVEWREWSKERYKASFVRTFGKEE